MGSDCSPERRITAMPPMPTGVDMAAMVVFIVVVFMVDCGAVAAYWVSMSWTRRTEALILRLVGAMYPPQSEKKL